MKLSVSVLFCLLGMTVSGVDKGLEPYLPPPTETATQTVMTRNQLELKLENGQTLRPGEFSRERSLNGKWRFSGVENSSQPFSPAADMDKGFAGTAFDDSAWNEIDVPLSWHLKYPKSIKRGEPYVKGWYRRSFTLSKEELSGKRVFLHFGALGNEGRLFVNGREAGTHLGDFTSMDSDITAYVKEGENHLAVRVFRDYGPMHGGKAEAAYVYGPQYSPEQIKAGLWQDVTLRFESPLRFSRILVTPELPSGSIVVDYLIDNPHQHRVAADLNGYVSSAMSSEANRLIASASPGQIILEPGINEGKLTIALKNPVLWTPEQPWLYFLSLALAKDGQIITAAPARFGMRDFKVREGNFYLNGKPVYLFGENLPAMHYEGLGRSSEIEKKRISERLKRFKSLGYNVIRNAHMPMSPVLNSAADELGMMIYNEWAWCFTSKINEKAFAENNSRQVREWVHRDYNHPSVVMWSGGNEVVYKNCAKVKRQLEEQYDLIRRLDRSGRPICNFSGIGASPYGTEKLRTDVIDIHTYIGLGNTLWTDWKKSFNPWYERILKNFGDDGKLSQAFVIWECVGFSWGQKSDPGFKLNDIRAYGKYVSSPTSWSNPNGIGFAGTIGLAAALDPKRGNRHGQSVYGRRIAEQIRQDLRIKGFAPWFHGCSLQMARLWTQPIYCGLRDEAGIMPRNLFSGKQLTTVLFVVNSSDRDMENAVLRLSLADGGGKEILLREISLPTIRSWSMHEENTEFTLPVTPGADFKQLRLTIISDTKEKSRNFYDVFVRNQDIMRSAVDSKIAVTILKPGKSGYLELLTKAFQDMGLKYQVINGLDNIPANGLLVAGPGSGYSDSEAGKLRQWITDGGTLLLLEHTAGSLPLPGDLTVESAPSTFVDIAIPAHPVFKGLSQTCFDTWNNPDRGLVVRNMISPFTDNALALRGPLLGQGKTGTAVFEGIMGQGRVFCSQLPATELWGGDSAATTYLHNLMSYLTNPEKYLKNTAPIISRVTSFQVDAARLRRIDLKAHANRGFSDDVENDGKGGWTDEGKNDFRMILHGDQTVCNIPFSIIDPDDNNGNGCIILRGSMRQSYPEAVGNIRIDDKFSRLFFLHTCAWGKGQEAGRFRMFYEDGTHADHVMIEGVNVSNWWDCVFLPEGAVGMVMKNPVGRNVCLSVSAWDNPWPDKKITRMDFLCAGDNNVDKINYLPTNSPMPILVAVSGELAHPEPLRIFDGETAKQAWDAVSWRGGDLPTVRRVAAKDESVNVHSGKYAAEITMPARKGNGVPAVLMRFPLKPVKNNTYTQLSFWIKAESASGSVEFVLPDAGWKQYRIAMVNLDSPGKWKKIRLRIPDDMPSNGKEFPLTELRGELLIYNGNSKRAPHQYVPVKFLIDDVRLE